MQLELQNQYRDGANDKTRGAGGSPQRKVEYRTVFNAGVFLAGDEETRRFPRERACFARVASYIMLVFWAGGGRDYFKDLCRLAR